MLVKFLSLFGKTSSIIIKMLAFLSRKFFKFLFYNSLVKIYYTIFRIKRNDLEGKPLKLFLKKEISGLIVFAVAFFLIISNVFTAQESVQAANNKLSKTTVASLIASDFDTGIEEELIEEFLTPSILGAAKQKSLEKDYQVAEKNDLKIEDNDSSSEVFLSLNEAGDLVFKPKNVTEENKQNSSSQRTEIEKYIVQPGDTVSTIAGRFGITINTVLWANNLGNYSIIKPGQELTILPYSGIIYKVKSGDTLSKIANTYKINDTDISEKNNIDINLGLKIGQELILPGASRIVAAAPVRVNPASTPNTTSSVNKVPNTQSSGDNMAWPTEGHRISQYFTWSHNGLDIANKVGTPIYAAEAGTIEISATGWNGGYGNTLLINHGNGKKTRYGHLTSLYVKVGDKVTKGENIGTMGSTGRSTGSHLHFEVIINGARYNPLNYIKY